MAGFNRHWRLTRLAVNPLGGIPTWRYPRMAVNPHGGQSPINLLLTAARPMPSVPDWDTDASMATKSRPKSWTRGDGSPSSLSRRRSGRVTSSSCLTPPLRHHGEHLNSHQSPRGQGTGCRELHPYEWNRPGPDRLGQKRPRLNGYRGNGGGPRLCCRQHCPRPPRVVRLIHVDVPACTGLVQTVRPLKMVPVGRPAGENIGQLALVTPSGAV